MYVEELLGLLGNRGAVAQVPGGTEPCVAPLSPLAPAVNAPACEAAGALLTLFGLGPFGSFCNVFFFLFTFDA